MVPLSAQSNPYYPAFRTLALRGVLHRTRYLPRIDMKQLATWAARLPDDWVGSVCREANEVNKPAALVLLAHLTNAEDKSIYKLLFPEVIETLSDLSGFVAAMTSGVVGRRSLGSGPKAQVRNWLANRSTMSLFREDEGNLAYIVRLCRPRPATAIQEAYFGTLVDRPVNLELLPQPILDLQFFKMHPEGMIPDVPARYLLELDLDHKQKQQLVGRMTWTEMAENFDMLLSDNSILKDAELMEALTDLLMTPDSTVTPLAAYELTLKTRQFGGAIYTASLFGLSKTYSHVKPCRPGAFIVEHSEFSNELMPTGMSYFEAAAITAWSLAHASEDPMACPIYLGSNPDPFYVHETNLSELLCQVPSSNSKVSDSLEAFVESVGDAPPFVYWFGRSRPTYEDLHWTESNNGRNSKLTTWSLTDMRARPTTGADHLALSGMSNDIFAVLAI